MAFFGQAGADTPNATMSPSDGCREADWSIDCEWGWRIEQSAVVKIGPPNRAALIWGFQLSNARKAGNKSYSGLEWALRSLSVSLRDELICPGNPSGRELRHYYVIVCWALLRLTTAQYPVNSAKEASQPSRLPPMVTALQRLTHAAQQRLLP